jgi:hypothetical protein
MRHTEFADDDHVQRGAQGIGHLVGHRHPTARQADDDHPGTGKAQQALGKPASGFGPVPEQDLVHGS